MTRSSHLGRPATPTPSPSPWLGRSQDDSSFCKPNVSLRHRSSLSALVNDRSRVLLIYATAETSTKKGSFGGATGTSMALYGMLVTNKPSYTAITVSIF